MGLETFETLMVKLAEQAKELEAYKKTGLTPEQIYEMDRLYAEKCREVAEYEKQMGRANK